MRNLIKMEKHKLLSSFSYKILILIYFFIFTMSSIRNYIFIGKITEPLLDLNNSYVFSIIICSFYIGNDFSENTIILQTQKGYSRLKILISKFIIFLVYIFPFFILLLLISTIAYIVQNNSYADIFNIKYIFVNFLMYILISFLYFGIIFIFFDTAKTLIISLTVWIFKDYIYAFIFKIFPFSKTIYNFLSLENMQNNINYLILFLIFTVSFVLFFSFLRFNKRNLN